MAQFDLAQASLPIGATFTRQSGPYTFIGPDKLLQTGNTANLVRQDYDASTGVLLGTLAEPSNTNWFLQSAVINTSWSRDNANLVADALTSQFGSPNLSRMEASTAIVAGGAFRIYQTARDTDTTQKYIRSIYCKIGTASLRYLWVSRDGGGQVCFDMLNGIIVSASGGLTGSATPLPNGIFRLSILGPGISAGGNNTFFWLCDRTSSPLMGSAQASGVFGYVGGAQSEVATPSQNYASSYIPTTTVAVTRPEEVLILNWSSQGVLDGLTNVAYTFANDSIQKINQQVSARSTTVPTNLLSYYSIKKISILQTPLGRKISITDTARRIAILST